jgi:hypothetical protein
MEERRISLGRLCLLGWRFCNRRIRHGAGEVAFLEATSDLPRPT